MNIGLVTTWFPAGAGYVSRAYRNLLEEQSHVVYIYARSGQRMKGDRIWDDKQVTWARQSHIGTGIWRRHFQKWIKSNGITHLLFNEQRYWKPIVWAKDCGVVCGAYVDYYTQSSVECFDSYDFLICNTKRHYSVFDWHRNCSYVPWGTDIRKYKPRDFITRRQTTFIVSAGWEPFSSGDRRGSILALSAFKKCHGNCRLLFYSQVPVDRMSDIWRDALSKDERIEIRVGSFDPFPFCEGDVYLYPSRLDGIGLTLPEAVSSGLATIATDCPPMSEFVIDNVTGRLVKVAKYLGRADGYYWAESLCDRTHLQEVIQSFIDEPHTVDRYKSEARKYAEQNLDWRKNASSLSLIFRSANHCQLSREQLASLSRADKQYAPNALQQLSRLAAIVVRYVR